MISPPSWIFAPLRSNRPLGIFRYTLTGRGFTLLEMLVVLVLLSIAAAVSVPATGRFLNSLDFRKETQAIRATLNQARLLAVTSGKKVTVTVEENAPALRLTGPKNVIRKFGSRDSELVLNPEAIIFLPEGRATPALVTYRRNDRTWEIGIDPLTGLAVEE